MTTSLLRGTVTLLFSDIEGSTRLLEELGAGYTAALTRYRTIIRGSIAAQGGAEVDTQGDAFFAVFGVASNAVAAARESQRSLAATGVRARMGIHTGTPEVTDEGYVGLDVHVGARIAAAAHGGQVLLSEATHRLVQADVRDLGHYWLKDLTEPLHLWQLGQRRFPPIRALYRSSLPTPSTPFIGREPEVQDVLDLLDRGVRLLTVTGPGGVGKTRLAMEAALRIVERYPDGVWAVPLAPLRDPRRLPDATSEAMGTKDDLERHIATKRMLIVFDNFEHLVTAAPVVARLVNACPNLTALVTSREPLHVASETEYRLGPMTEAEAVTFFEHSVRRFDPGFVSNDAVVEICHRLDDLPLALELAATRIKAFSPEELLRRLEVRLPALVGGPRDVPARHRTLRATLEWSHDLLNADERRLFAALSAFAGAFTADAAERIAGADVDTLVSLIDRSLLHRSGDRFVMLETIREFATERLRGSAAAVETYRRHADYFFALVDDPTIGTNARIVKELVRDHDNFEEALTWLCDVGEHEAELRLADRLFPLWIVGGFLNEGWTRLTEALSHDVRQDPLQRASTLQSAGDIALARGDYGIARGHLEEALRLFRELGTASEQVSCLVDLGHVAKCEADFDRAESVLRESVALAQGIGDGDLLAMALLNLGDCLVASGDYGAAIEPCEESLALAREAEDGFGISASLFSLGVAALREGRRDDARGLLLDSLRESNEAEYVEGMAYAVEGVAAVLAEDGPAEDTVRLLVAGEILRERSGVSLEPHERLIHDQTMSRLRERLGAERLAVVWAEGQEREVDELLSYSM